jgi:hypothetical protein
VSVTTETTTVPRLATTAQPAGERDAAPAPDTARPADARYRDHDITVPAGGFTAVVDRLRDLCRTAVVGDRVRLTGPEDELLRAAAVLRSGGFGDDEITLTTTTPGSPFSDPDLRRVVCCHCRTTFTTTLTVGDAATCPGCGRGLVVHHHFSRRTASYLAYQPEEQP